MAYIPTHYGSANDFDRAYWPHGHEEPRDVAITLINILRVWLSREIRSSRTIRSGVENAILVRNKVGTRRCCLLKETAETIKLPEVGNFRAAVKSEGCSYEYAEILPPSVKQI